MFTLSDQLAGVELRYNTLQNFIDDRWEDTFIIVLAKFTENGWDVIYGRLRKDTAGNVDHLKVYIL